MSVDGVFRSDEEILSLIKCEKRIPFRSLVIHENMDSLSSFNRQQIINVADKQFYSFEGFKIEGKSYLKREIA